MDVEMQLEASGLPTQFGTTSDQPEPTLMDNMAASISNSEATVAPVLPKEPAQEVPSTEAVEPAAPVAPVEALAETVAEAVVKTIPEPALPVSSEAPATNGVHNHGSDFQASISATTIPDSQPQPSLHTISTAPPETISTSESNLTESFIPSSIPAEIQSSATPFETSQSSMDISEPHPIPSEAPLSDLRTAPHADALTPEAVAKVEAQKHDLDNTADLNPAPIADIPEPALSTLPPIDAVRSKIGLPSPPAQSPPPPPQPTPAVLPEPIAAPEPPAPEPATTLSVLPPEEPQIVATEPFIPAPPEPTPSEPADEVMTDVSTLVNKAIHDREEDDEEIERAAKRVRTEEPELATEDSHFKIPDIPMVSSPAVANGDSTTSNVPADGDDSITQPRLAHMKKVISNLKKSNASANFRLPVDPVALKIPTYPMIIKHPMDLGTIDQRLKRNEYSSVAVFVADFELIVNNCYAFNGPDHGVSQQAKKMKQSFDGQMKNLPKASLEEPSKEIKKAAKKAEPTRTAPPRRPSVSTSTVNVTSAESPVSAAPTTPAFALNPDGMPLIRRDSNMADGRPKRAIVPTKRNSEFGAGRPRKKKYEQQLKFCDEVLKDLTSQKNWQANQYFMDPVDPVALNIPTYFQIIKKPMDLKMVRQKLGNNEYEKAKDFEDDVRLIIKNCFKFNPEGDLVNSAGHLLEDLFNSKWAGKDEWLAEREPTSVTQSDADDDDDDEEDGEESEEDGNGSEEDRNDRIKKLQAQIAEMSKQMGELTKESKKSKSPKAGKKKDKAKAKKEKSDAAAPKTSKDKKETKKKSTKKPEKERYVTFAEKQYISNGIAMLPEKQMQEALKIIQLSVPSLANSEQSEIELDIEEVPNSALLKLLGFVKKYAGPPPDEPKVETTDTYHASAPMKSKKSKPMSKHEQEAQIEELKGKLGAYAGPISPNAVQSIETGDSSDDDDSGEESEEE